MATHGHALNSQAVNAAQEVRKRLFVFCDGTWQDGVNKTQPLTNVATLARCLKPIDNDGCLQIIYYDGGLGNSPGTLSQVIDGATGRGISAKIRNAYSFLSHNYNFSERRDETVLVGFSRGAFAVQCLAAFISDAGLLESKHLYYLRGLFTLWSCREVFGGEQKFQETKHLLIESGLLHPIRITACAVWDTVSALGVPTQIPPRPLAFVGRTVPLSVQNAFHAVALDERRREFRPVIWETRGASKADCVNQCWFLGSHSDVGGNGDAALGALSFLWMVGKLQDKVGVSFNEEEIAKHLKHKYLEWDFVVSRLGKTFKETRALSMRKHSGQPTPKAWYWNLLGWQSRAVHILKSCSLPSEVHFSVRLVMATSTSFSAPLKRWTASWQSPASTIPSPAAESAQWHAPHEFGFIGHSAGSGVDGNQNRLENIPYETPALNEHPLDVGDTEHTLLQRWSHGFRFPKTDRHKFAQQLEEQVQQDGANDALKSLKTLLKDYLHFDEDGKLMVKLTYPNDRSLS
ncbi:hypothetical protein QBC34DRAFT_331785 [Podospora aff. communis PSN243]|uniref:T6SS Phospholipase effector Tle1-like catalytic domain-containing protein n=1 Tax=Podospora aff. communis PSN243 TaxID=3040156 RepID=A0AAV9GEH7_9PEZI|nr:hypothetical protein QBC34DRAFT_331785 [Podospora aff. communis PSN243]